MQQIPAHAGESSLIAWLLFSLEGPACFFGSESGINRNGRLLFSEQNPVAILPGKFTPRSIHIVAKSDQDVTLVLPAPGWRPGCDRAFANGQRIVGGHRLFGGIINAPNTVTVRTSAFRAVGRERLTMELR